MADFVAILSIKTLLQDVSTSPSSTLAEPNTSMLDEAVMDRTYYMGLQSTRPEDDPLHLAGKLPSPAWLQHILAWASLMRCLQALP